MTDRLGCPRCRQDLVRRLRHARVNLPDFPVTPASARYYGADALLYVGIAAAAASVIAAGVGAYASYASSRAQSSAMQYNAALAEQQAAAQYQQAQAVAMAQAQYQMGLGEMEASMLERQAQNTGVMAEAEMLLAQRQAEAAQAAGDLREAGIQRAYTRTQSEVRAAIGKSGVDTTGSPLLVLLENADTVGMELAINDYQTALDVAGEKAGGSFAAAEGHMRADALMQEATLRRFGAQVGAAGAQAGLGQAASNYSAGIGQASMLRMQAGNVRSAGMWNVGTSLLGGVSGAISPFLRYGSSGSSGTTGGYPSGRPAFG